MSITKLFPNNYLPDLAKVALWVGVNAAGVVLLMGVSRGTVHRNELDWRDVAVWGTIGAIVGAQFGVANKFK
jgi:hypothetical protein